jgi:V/A-type H+-transporting ATPase subunit I
VECDEKEAVDVLHCIDTMFLSIPDEIRKINEDLHGTALEWGPKLASMFILIDEELEETVVAQRSNSAEEYFLLEGWIPADDFTNASALLKERFGASIFLHWRYPTSDEWQDVPTVLSNSSHTRPYQLFISL